MTSLERQKQEGMALVDSLKSRLIQEEDPKGQAKILKELNTARAALKDLEATQDEVTCLRCNLSVDIAANDHYAFKVVEVITPPGEDNINRYGDSMRLVYCRICGPVILEEVFD